MDYASAFRRCEKAMQTLAFTCNYTLGNGTGHFLLNFPQVLRLGFKGIKARVEESLAGLDLSDPDDFDKITFCRAMIEICDGVMLFVKRYSELAALMAAEKTAEASNNGTDRARKHELEAIGCGGGKVLQILSSLIPNATLYGIDHSADMVALARKHNKAGISSGKIIIVQGCAEELSFTDTFFDVVTAFDTINFWQDVDRALTEIQRVLHSGGHFIIVNGYPAEGTKWYDFVTFKNDDAYREALEHAGFAEVHTAIEKQMIIVRGQKVARVRTRG